MARLAAFALAALMLHGAASAQSEATLAGMAAYNDGRWPKAVELLSEAAEAGDAEAMVNLGYLYARGHGVKEDQRKAFELYKRAADLGDPEGMNALGFKYRYGTGVPIDYAQAAYWFCEAVLRGHPRAMNNLAIMLTSGVVPRDLAEARNLWRQSAAAGHSNGMYNLALSFAYEEPRDSQAAYDWILRAARAGHPDAQAKLREGGNADPFPPPFEPGTTLKPSPRGDVGVTKTCGAYRT